MFERPLEIKFQEIDAAGVVFFARVFDYFHDTYVALLASRGISLAEVLAARRWAAPLAHAEADYRRPLRFGGAYVARITGLTAGASSLTVTHEIAARSAHAGDASLDAGPGAGAKMAAPVLHAVGQTVHVFLDPATGRPTSLPDEIRALVGAP